MIIKKCLIILFGLGLFCLMFSPVSQAGCTKECNGWTNVSLTVKQQNIQAQGGQRDEVILKRYSKFDSFMAEGSYGGGCKTSVGREKARKRACKALVNLFKEKYENKTKRWANQICADVKKGSLKISKRPNAKPEPISLKTVQWMEVDQLVMQYRAEDHGIKKQKSTSLKGNDKRFVCRGNTAVFLK